MPHLRPEVRRQIAERERRVRANCKVIFGDRINYWLETEVSSYGIYVCRVQNKLSQSLANPLTRTVGFPAEETAFAELDSITDEWAKAKREYGYVSEEMLQQIFSGVNRVRREIRYEYDPCLGPVSCGCTLEVGCSIRLTDSFVYPTCASSSSNFSGHASTPFNSSGHASSSSSNSIRISDLLNSSDHAIIPSGPSTHASNVSTSSDRASSSTSPSTHVSNSSNSFNGASNQFSPPTHANIPSTSWDRASSSPSPSTHVSISSSCSSDGASSSYSPSTHVSSSSDSSDRVSSSSSPSTHARTRSKRLNGNRPWDTWITPNDFFGSTADARRARGLLPYPNTSFDYSPRFRRPSRSRSSSRASCRSRSRSSSPAEWTAVGITKAEIEEISRRHAKRSTSPWKEHPIIAKRIRESDMINERWYYESGGARGRLRPARSF